MTISSDIISSLGAGSGINSNRIVEQLVEIERTAKQTPIDQKREKLEAQISDYGLMRSALSLLQDSADLLSDEDSFEAKNATFTDSNALVPLGLENAAPPGDYTFDVQAIAAAQSLSSNADFAAPSDAVGKGVLTFSFGEWDAGGPVQDPPQAFTADSTKDAFSITINDSNNSLTGLRDAINAADKGVQASIINNGTGYRLVITSQSGATNELQIAVTEAGGSPTNTDGNDLSRFAFGEGIGGANQQMTQNQAGADASLIVNGLSVSRSNNTIDDIIEGFEFSLVKADPGAVMTVTIFEDTAAAEESVRGFVESFNAFLEAMEPLTGFNEALEANGSLNRDTTTKTIMSAIRNEIAAAIPGLGEGFTTLAAVGIRTDRDGGLIIDEDSFSTAFNDNFELVQALFAPQTSSSNSAVEVTGVAAQTIPGNYEVEISQNATQGGLVGGVVDDTSLLSDLLTSPTAANITGAGATVALVNLDGAAATEFDFSLSIDGTSSGTISLTPGSYASFAELAAEMQTQINADADLLAAGAAVDVSHDGANFIITSRLLGDSSAVSAITAIGPSATALGLDAASSPVATAGSGKNFDFSVALDGATSNTISLTAGSYTVDTLAAHIQAQINNDSALSAVGSDVSVVWDTDHFEITSNSYGASSAVSMTALGADAGDLGLASGTATAGINVAGSFDGVTGFGVGQVLLAALNTDPNGLTLIVEPGATTTTVNYSAGFGRELSSLLQGFLQSNGILDTRSDNLDNRLERLADDEDKVERRIEAYQARLSAQFLAMERIVASLNSSGGLLDDIGDRLPFTNNFN